MQGSLGDDIELLSYWTTLAAYFAVKICTTWNPKSNYQITLSQQKSINWGINESNVTLNFKSMTIPAVKWN